MSAPIGVFEATAEQGGVRCGILDDEIDDWLAATEIMSLPTARLAAASLQRAIHEAERGGEDQAGQH